jgi:dethiobiotin synthetase
MKATVTERPANRRPHPAQGRVILITGTDTGAGKTVLTSLLLCHLRGTGCRALALKPFCSGDCGDVQLLRACQDRELSADEINPWFFPEPVAPLVSARKHRRRVRLEKVAEHIESFRKYCDYLLVEGAGGLLVPLGEGYTVLDLIQRLQCEVLIAAQNRLGILNHTLLTIRVLQGAGHAPERPPGWLRAKVALMDGRRGDASSSTNRRILAELIAPVPLIGLPYLGPGCRRVESIRAQAAKLCGTLARLVPEGKRLG